MPVPLLSATVLRVRPAGVTEDFCPVCRQERVFRLGVAEHRRVVFLLDRGRVGHEHHELTCQSCRCVMERPASERPIPHRPSRAAAATHRPECLPIVRRRIADCTRMEALRRAGKVKADLREEMIRHAVHCFARLYDEQPTERVRPGVWALILLATAGAGTAGFFAWTRWERPVVAFILVGAAVLLWLCLWRWVAVRSPRKRVRTWLAMALAPLDASEAEIRQARRELQTMRIGAGFKLQPHMVRRKIERVRRSGRAPA